MKIPINVKNNNDSAIYDKTIFREKYAKLNYIIKNLSIITMIVVMARCYIYADVNLIAFVIALLGVYYYVLSKYYIKEKENIVSRYALVYDDEKVTEVIYINVKDSCLEVYEINVLSDVICRKKEIVLKGHISVTKDYISEHQLEPSEEIVDTVTIPRVFVNEVEEMFYRAIDKGGVENEQEHIQ